MEQFIKTESELSLSISKGKLIVKDTPEKYKNLKLSNSKLFFNIIIINLTII